MSMTDPIADMLTRIRNINKNCGEKVDIPFSKIKMEIARILKAEGYIKNYWVMNDNNKKYIRVFMKYGSNKEKVIHGLKRVSRPGLRVYVKSKEIPRVLGGLGISILSTSRGIMTGLSAKKSRLGGEVLCYVW